MKLLLVLGLTLSISGCITVDSFVNMKDYGVYSSDHVGNKKFDDIAPVYASNSGFIWDDCDKVAADTIKEMLDDAKAHGGNTVYNIKFHDGKKLTTVPTCTVRLGWFVLLVTAAGPWMKNVAAEGQAAKLDGEAAADSIRLSPESDTALLATTWVRARLTSKADLP